MAALIIVYCSLMIRYRLVTNTNMYAVFIKTYSTMTIVYGDFTMKYQVDINVDVVGWLWHRAVRI